MPPPGPALCPSTRDLDLLHCLVGVVGDVDVDTDGFSMVVDLGGVRRERDGWEDSKALDDGEGKEAPHTSPGVPQALATLTLAPSSSATSH